MLEFWNMHHIRHCYILDKIFEKCWAKIEQKIPSYFIFSLF